MKVCVPVSADGLIDPRWGRADRVAVASVRPGAIESWEEFDVGWGRSHDDGPEGQHHARIARFLRDHAVEVVAADHMGPPMQVMLQKMGIVVRLGAAGQARAAVLRAAGSGAGG